MDFTIRRNNGGRIIWSQDQINYIINEYKKNPTTGKIANQFQVTKEAIRSLLKRNNIHVLSSYEYGVRNYPRDIYAFTKKTSSMAYWLGFLYADGCIQNNAITINLNISDITQLEKFKNYIKANNTKIIITEKITNEKTYKGCHFSLKDKYIANTLKTLGVIPNKSLILQPPTLDQVPYELQWDFIRGYFDGDGYLSIDKRNHHYNISFAGTKEMLLFLQEKTGKTDIILQKISTNNSYVFKVCGNNNIRNILTNMYKNSTDDTRLERKYALYLEYINYCA